MKRSLVFLKVGRREPVADDHIGLLLKNVTRESAGVFRGICIVAVRHQVTLGVYLLEHAAHDVSLALLVLIADYGTRRAGDLVCAVGGVVIIDIYDRLRKLTTKVGHDLRYGLSLVIAGDKNRDFIHYRSLLCFCLYSH